MALLQTIVTVFLELAGGYFFLANSFYIFLFVLALFSIRRRERLKPMVRHLDALGFSPAVTVIVPAYNEEKSIVDSVHSLLRLRYSNIEVVVVNDGSTDTTLECLKKAAGLYIDNTLVTSDFASSLTVRGVYRSAIPSNLIVIDKTNSGKASSLNVGIGYGSHDLICSVDSDSILDDDALLSIVRPFVENPVTVASGGSIQLANGSTIRHSRIIETHMPKQWIARVQIVEYIRSFFCGRVGLDALNSTLVISGAFGIFRRDALQKVGGYKTTTLGEDMDLVVRLHRYFREQKEDYSIVFLPDPVCWTEAPSDWMTLYRQRRRWQIGLLQCLSQNRDMFLNPKYGMIGMFAFPSAVIIDVLGPMVEITAYVCLIFGCVMGFLSSSEIFLFMFVSFLYGLVISVGAVVIGELYYNRYKNLSCLATLVLSTFVETVGYRQLNSIWRIRAFFGFIRGEHTWGKMKRAGLSGDTPVKEKAVSFAMAKLDFTTIAIAGTLAVALVVVSIRPFWIKHISSKAGDVSIARNADQVNKGQKRTPAEDTKEVTKKLAAVVAVSAEKVAVVEDVQPVVAPVDVKPAAAAEPSSGLFRATLIVSDLNQASTKITEKLKELGSEKAGDVELGWKKTPVILYYHLIIPDQNLAEAKNFLSGFGKLNIRFEKHPKLIPAGTDRLILEVQKK